MERFQFPIVDPVLGEDTSTGLMGISGLNHILLQSDPFPLYTGYPVPSQHILSYHTVGDNVNSAFISLHTGLDSTAKNQSGTAETCVLFYAVETSN